ncbi:MAG: PFL family protein [Lachnospirales bacterium]
MIEKNEILETNSFIEKYNFDIRTLTMGISLLNCIDSSVEKTCSNIYTKILKFANNFVETCDRVAQEYGIKVVNKRISVTPISLIVKSTSVDDYLKVAKALDKAAEDVGIDFIGGFSALVQNGCTDSDRALIKSLPKVLANTNKVCASVNLGSTKSGINMNGVRDIGQMILETSELTKNMDSIGCAKFVVFCNSVGDNPFMAGAYHGIENQEVCLSVGVSGPGVVKNAIENNDHVNFNDLCEIIKKASFKLTRTGQLVAKHVAREMNLPFGTIDLSLAPTPAMGDSIAEIIEVMGIEKCGAPGTTAALAILNDNVKKGGVMASSHVGGLSGAFIPVSEDKNMIEAVKAGAINIEKLEAMTCVCSVGLDMIAIPGDTSAATISGIIADEMAIGMVNGKTTAVRIIPVYGKKVGDMAEFGGLLGYAPIMPVSKFSSATFINRGGRIAPPIHSFKN